MLPRLLPKEPSRGISPPDFPLSAPAFSLACLLNCTSHGCLKQCFCPAQTWGGSCCGSASFSHQLSLLTRGKGRKGQGLFLHQKKKNCLFSSGGGLVRFFCLSGSSGTEVLSPTHMHTSVYTLGIIGRPVPTPAVRFLFVCVPLLLPQQPGLNVASIVLSSLLAWAGVTSQGLPFR